MEGDHRRRTTTNATARAGFLPRRVFRIVFPYYHIIIIIIVSERVPISIPIRLHANNSWPTNENSSSRASLHNNIIIYYHYYYVRASYITRS